MEGLGTFGESPQHGGMKRPFLLSYCNLCAVWDPLWNGNYFSFSRGLLCSGGYRASINDHRSPSKPHRLPSSFISVRCGLCQISKRGNKEIKNECPRSREDALQKNPPARLYLSIHSVDAPALPRTFMLDMNAMGRAWGGGGRISRCSGVSSMSSSSSHADAHKTQIPFTFERGHVFLSDYIEAFFFSLQLLVACSYWEWVF